MDAVSLGSEVRGLPYLRQGVDIDMGEAAADEADFDFIIGSTPDGRIVVDFRGMRIDHMKLKQDEALEMAEGLVEAVQQAKQGIIISLDRMN